ncbi:MAG TPA: 2-succinyl-5-enolpyruvyl-6-hydroxy-3-cyclohexene-1-carboxylic-acid synthase [Stenomitos sp.]
MNAPNLNALWAEVLIETLYAAGVRDVCVTPGSRSTPLAYAVDAHPGIRPFVHLDERASAFFALGLAKATGRPVALVCTSGTAAANYYPAVIEASLSGVPLIVLSADRPLSLRDTGAPQTVDQVRMFGSYVRYYAETPLPETALPALRRLAASAAQACALACSHPRGPVQLNVPFADPLPPLPSGDPALPSLAAIMEGTLPYEIRGRILPNERAVSDLAVRLAKLERGLIVAGPEIDEGAAPWILELARRLGYPVLADLASGVRFRDGAGAVVCAHSEAILRSQALSGLAPEVVLRVGGLPTSATLNAYLARTAPLVVALQSDFQRHDPEALVTLTLQGEPEETLGRLCNYLAPQKAPTSWLERFQQADAAASAALGAVTVEATEALAVQAAIAAMPRGSAVFLSNSMPIRFADSLCDVAASDLRVLVSRGANGIDGITSTALGIAAGLGRPTLLVTGDVAFLHDLGGLLGARHLSAPFVALVLNNDGGGIFSHLPISQCKDIFEPYWGTPHGCRFEAAAGMFGFDYAVASTPEAVEALVANLATGSKPLLIEVPTEREAQTLAYKDLMRAMTEAADRALLQEAAS